jgi:hypothetical protein
MTNHYRAHLLPTHFDFRKTESASSFEKSQILARIRRKTVEDGLAWIIREAYRFGEEERFADCRFPIIIVEMNLFPGMEIYLD